MGAEALRIRSWCKMRKTLFKRGLALLLLMMMTWTSGAALAEEDEPRKVVYLTFDDGPKKDTPELLKLLDELDVPATFFLVGAGVRAFPENTKLILEAGHAVGSHSMNHSINRLDSTGYLAEDLQNFIDTMRKLVDPEFSTDLFRFPGGSTIYSKETKAFVRDLGYAWFDWNMMTGDAQYKFDSNAKMLHYTTKQLGNKDVVIVLMHEAKTRTRRILPDLVAFFRERGYEFRKLSTDPEDVEILSRCSANLMLPAAQE